MKAHNFILCLRYLFNNLPPPAENADFRIFRKILFWGYPRKMRIFCGFPRFPQNYNMEVDFLWISAFSTTFYFVFTVRYLTIHRRLRKTRISTFSAKFYFGFILTIHRLQKTRISCGFPLKYLIFILFNNPPPPAVNKDFLRISKSAAACGIHSFPADYHVFR